MLPGQRDNLLSIYRYSGIPQPGEGDDRDRDLSAGAGYWVTPSGRARRRFTSVPAQIGIATALEGCIAEARLRNPSALKEEPDLVFVGHAYTAMHLHAFVADEKERVAGLGLGKAGETARAGIAGVERRERGDDGGACQLDLAEHLRGPVLQCLERADGYAELLAVLEIQHSALKGLGCASQHLRGEPRTRPVEHALQDPGAGIDLAEDRALAEVGAVEADDGSVATVDHNRAGAHHATGVARHQKQRNALRLVAAPRRARRDDQQIGDVPVEDEALLAVEPPAQQALVRFSAGHRRVTGSQHTSQPARRFHRRRLPLLFE